MELTNLTIAQVYQALIKKEFSALELCQAYLDKIKKEDKKVSAFLTINEDFALSQAKKIDDIISTSRGIPLLAGIPCAIKDNILVEGIRCTAASKILENYIAPYDATVIKKLKREGCVILGKTNLDEFAMGSSTENSAFGPTRNPYDLTRVPGGSSGGSAAAVAGNLCVYALGSDTGGSIRQPASFCGVVGLKPTYGAVSRYGLIAFASSLDQIGPITKTVEDCQIVFEAISGKDELDSTSVESKISNLKFQISNLRIGVPREYFIKGIEPEVEKIIKQAIKKYEELGAKIEEIKLPHTEYALPCYYIIAPSEAGANLARYDGIKYGYSTANNPTIQQSNNLIDVYLKSREEGFGAEVRRRIMLGTYALSAGYYEAYYLKALKVRTLIKEDFDQAFKKVDVIFTPVSPTPGFKLGEKITDPLTMYLSDIFTVSVNLAGLPALSLPCGKIGKLPVGLQIIGQSFEENKILTIGEIFEKT
ncbi:MAG: aspartyl/glutamyl-tRNA amidotransferase subunit A [Parcubacteria group bacterium CG2_30_36_18]|uniref:Glutamyl-tRNA(Gln) amidotransferase subunit A n=3 Tax=Candidatus Nealsoniibacteriota TaxID=1817911 RepID=A0A2M7MFA4_9BACT|nr:MAG: aspartyl/glutamyl-tRNA amidotransferase subunit A [Parcubacteria group bacterium CG2_30_36_18]PIP24608.1 MAG: Asp-tRNA(Asn)/Glu-tRNA(Gln) amidotransferase GatCAB subunit A [Candidatus Nealsonbacteria bacterium CG23_combo_of_CG06-09_8_20_14_all_36_125]PIR72094.1 MAG: Asp-tRNA(Asn)/Glu-tRNA(Gln) amidotransferase GatCAB subunit A [Candidatus Nealsonbacteria bacterium CG10_big_fil_rev_8_21_14_0_10_36_228]PIX88363.1 MAG: Asp-tRNA(Asn)/Glu-tRNA(Gln) amidotransferase GatCAB subunit A [Candidatu